MNLLLLKSRNERRDRLNREGLFLLTTHHPLLTSSPQPPHPNPRSSRLPQMHSVPIRSQCHRLIILALKYFHFGRRPQLQPFQKFQKLPILLVNTKNLRVLVSAQIRQQYRALTSQLGHASPHRHAVRTSLLVAESLEQKRLDFRRNSMLQPLRFVMRLSPRKPNHFRKQHLRQLMPQSQSFRHHAPFVCKIDPAGSLHAHVPVARHTLQCCRHRRRRHLQLLSQARTDRRLILFQHLPNRLEIVFLRNASFLSPHSSISSTRLILARCLPRARLPSRDPFPFRASHAPKICCRPTSSLCPRAPPRAARYPRKFSDTSPRPNHTDLPRPNLPPSRRPGTPPTPAVPSY